MARTEIQNELYPDCPIRNILARISDKWSILILFTLNQSELMRFNALQKNIPDISQKMLTVTLRTLEEDGFVKRQVYAEVPPRVEYSLTDRATSLLPHINSLIMWAKENMDAILMDRTNNRLKSYSIPKIKLVKRKKTNCHFSFASFILSTLHPHYQVEDLQHIISINAESVENALILHHPLISHLLHNVLIM